MRELEIVRISDGKRLWMSCGDSAAALEEISFECLLNRGGYLSISFKQRRAAIFPQETFWVDGEQFYFGPTPRPHQPVRPSRITWTRSPNPEPPPKLGMANVHVAGSLALLTYRRSTAALKTQLIRRCKPSETVRFIACFLASAMTLPMTAHAPNTTLAQILQERAVVALHNEMEQIRSEADEKADAQRLVMPSPGPKAQLTTHQPSNRPKQSENRSNDSDCSIPSSIAQLLGEREILQRRSRCQRGTLR